MSFQNCFGVVIAFDVLFSGSVKVVADKCFVPKFCFSSFSLKQMSKRYKVSKMCVLSTVAIAPEPSSQTQVPNRCPQGHGLLALVVLRQLHLHIEHLIADTQPYSFQLPARKSRMSSVQSVTQRKRTQFYQNKDNNGLYLGLFTQLVAEMWKNDNN